MNEIAEGLYELNIRIHRLHRAANCCLGEVVDLHTTEW